MIPNEKALLTLVAHHPNLRAVQLADQLDLTVDEVEGLLRPHLVAGNVVEDEVLAPNQRPAMAYALSEQFKASEAFLAMMGRADAGEASLAVAQPQSEPTVAVPVDAAVASAGDTAGVSAPAGTKIDRAIACVREHGIVTSGQLRVSIGLSKGQHPSSYLGPALRDGRLARDGDNWILGPTLAPKAEVDPVTLPAPTPRVGIPRFTDPIRAPEVAALPVATSFRCAIWSDGVLELQRGGATIACLSAVERGELMSLLAQ